MIGCRINMIKTGLCFVALILLQNEHVAATEESTDSETDQTGTDNNIPSNTSDTTAVLSGDAFASLSGWGNNVALRRPAFQSSEYRYDRLGLASHGVDGNTNMDYRKNACTHTDHQQHPWWAVDLGQTYRVTSVTIYNRADCCSERLRNFYIGVTDVSPRYRRPSVLSGANYKICHYQGGPARSLASTYRCRSSVSGRYVLIQLTQNEFLHVCEVQVQGTPENAVRPIAPPPSPPISRRRTWNPPPTRRTRNPPPTRRTPNPPPTRRTRKPPPTRRIWNPSHPNMHEP